MSARLRARLLEALKFRVLAAQESFFPPADGAGDDLSWFRSWLVEAWPEALALSNDDLRLCLEQARKLYLDG